MRSAIFLTTAAVLLAVSPEDRTAEREQMVRVQIAARGISSRPVLDSMRSVRRHVFIPEAMRVLAYRDTAVPIGYGQTISQPYIVALMTELLDVQRRHRVLEIGTGSGYQAAVLARLAGQVYTIERNAALAERARAVLTAEGVRNVTFRIGDGYLGWPEEPAFDRIIVTAAPERVPPALVEQLAPGGRLVAPVGRSADDQDLVVIQKDSRGRVTERSAGPVRFVPMLPGTEHGGRPRPLR